MSSVVLATAGYDHSIRFWEATSGVCFRTLQYPDSQVNKIEITADKTHLAAAGNSHIRVFDVNSNDPQPVISYEGHTGNVTAVGFQKDSKWMFSGGCRYLKHAACMGCICCLYVCMLLLLLLLLLMVIYAAAHPACISQGARMDTSVCGTHGAPPASDVMKAAQQSTQ